jgi:hypothetical protein
MGLGDYVKAAKIAAGLKFRREETMSSLLISLKKGGAAFLGVLVVAVGAALTDPHTLKQATEALASNQIPFVDQLATALLLGVGNGLRNWWKHRNDPKQG